MQCRLLRGLPNVPSLQFWHILNGGWHEFFKSLPNMPGRILFKHVGSHGVYAMHSWPVFSSKRNCMLYMFSWKLRPQHHGHSLSVLHTPSVFRRSGGHGLQHMPCWLLYAQQQHVHAMRQRILLSCPVVHRLHCLSSRILFSRSNHAVRPVSGGLVQSNCIGCLHCMSSEFGVRRLCYERQHILPFAEQNTVHGVEHV